MNSSLAIDRCSALHRIALFGALINLSASVAECQDPAPSPADIEFFQQQVLPILEAKCWKCHGPDESNGGLRLDHRDFVLRGGELGPAISLDDPDESNLLKAINYEDLEMPPSGKLSAEQIKVLTAWVGRRAPWPPGARPSEASPDEPVEVSDAAPHWAYQPVSPIDPPEVADPSWAANPIDRFVLARLEAKGLRTNPRASDRVLLRRLHFDLLGLPPRVEEVETFIVDDRANAYDEQVDRLLSSPQFGEKWGRHWLDLVRYAETNGYERDGRKENAWRYRDYVIEAMNDDKPYDRFVIEQLAGDELVDRDTSSIIATGYYRLGVWDDEPADPDQAFYDSLDDVVSTTSLVFLGTTIGCARCHDHKIDPISQRDYYQMMAFFHNTHRRMRQLEFKKTPFTLNTQTVIASGEERERFAQQQQLDQSEIGSLNQRVEHFEKLIYQTFSNPEKEDAQDQEVLAHMIETRATEALSENDLKSYRAANKEIQQLRGRRRPPLASALAIKENGREAPDTHILVRGNAHAPGDRVEPAFPAALTNQTPVIPQLPSDMQSSGRRTALANWVVDHHNPLTARVIVNRVWQHHFGRGLVRTTSDFGRYGHTPTHPLLLDYLAAQLVQHDWHLKWLHRLILTSQTYQLSSQDDASGLKADPKNDLLWRFNMRRLTAEEVRDTVLSVAGVLNLTMRGPSIYCKIPNEILQSASRPDAAWGHSSPGEQVRRSVYVFVKRSISEPVLLAFDSPDKDGSCPVRFATTVPTQALTTLNGEFFNEQSMVLARRLQREIPNDPPQQVKRALSLALSREGTSEEVHRGIALLDGWQSNDDVSAEESLRYFCLLVLNLNEMIYID